jgi:hypothetical protein
MKNLNLNLRKTDYAVYAISAALFVLAVLPFGMLKNFIEALSPDHNVSFLTPDTVPHFRILFALSGFLLLALAHGMKFWVRLYAFLLALLFGIVFSGQALGFFKIYFPLYVFPLTLITTVVIYWIYCRYWFRDFYAWLGMEDGNENPFSLDRIFLVSGLLLMLLLIVMPVILWPYSSINSVLNWDVGKYHLPKAIEMANTGSAWDMSISYAAYPYGYESLFAFVVLLTRSGLLFGVVQTLGNLFFLLTLWFLLRRYTRLPVGILLCVAVLIAVSNSFWDAGNLWGPLQALLYSVGKNDLFLGAAVLAVILHAPFGHSENQNLWHPLGMGIAGMIALSTKPNAVLILVPLFIMTFYLVWFRSREEKPARKQMILIGAEIAALILPGLLWILRNWLARGYIFDQNELRLQNLSILNNLTNPNFYLHIPLEFYVLTGIFLLSIPFVVLRKNLTRRLWILFALLTVGFVATPVTAFIHNLDEAPSISWRFGVALLVIVLLVVLLMLEPWLRKISIFLLRQNRATFGLSLIMAGFTVLFLWHNRLTILPDMKNAIILEDQYSVSVGDKGYYSPFDYIHKNIRNSVIRVENGLPFYAYGPGFTNSTTLSRPAEYLIVLRTEWNKCGATYCAAPFIRSDYPGWKLLYHDSQGEVYKHR